MVLVNTFSSEAFSHSFILYSWLPTDSQRKRTLLQLLDYQFEYMVNMKNNAAAVEFSYYITVEVSNVHESIFTAHSDSNVHL